jgi:hypothetical protein
MLLPSPTSRLKALIAVPLAIGAAAAASATPAAASDHYQVDVFSSMTMTAHGAFGGYWTGNVDFDTDIDAQTSGLTVTDHHFPVLKPLPNRISVTSFKQHVDEVTPLGTYTWDCQNVGPARGKPGWVVLDKAGDTATVSIVAADDPTVTRACSGYSSFSGDLQLGGRPLKVEWSFPVSQLGAGGGATKRFDISLPCPDMMAFQDSCALHWQGNATIRRTDGDGSDTEDQPQEPKPEKKKPLKRVGGKLTKNAKSAKVTVNCTGPCQGKISATAIATKRMAEKKVATEHFSTRQAGPKKVDVIFGGKGARTVRRHGGVVIDVKAAPKTGGPSQTKSIKLRTSK